MSSSKAYPVIVYRSNEIELEFICTSFSFLAFIYTCTKYKICVAYLYKQACFCFYNSYLCQWKTIIVNWPYSYTHEYIGLYDRKTNWNELLRSQDTPSSPLEYQWNKKQFSIPVSTLNLHDSLGKTFFVHNFNTHLLMMHIHLRYFMSYAEWHE